MKPKRNFLPIIIFALISTIFATTSSVRFEKTEMKIDRTKTTSLIIESRPNKSSLVNLKNKGSVLGFSFGMSNRNFVLSSFNRETLTVLSEDQNKIKFGGRTVSLPSLKLRNIVKYNEQPQWRMIVQDSFTKNNTDYQGWNYKVITKCGKYLNIFGGNCLLSNKEIKREITDLPAHRLIKIEASFHFIGNWQGETGFLKINTQGYNSSPSYLWTYRCNRNRAKKSIAFNTCGYDVCQMNYPVSVTIPHQENRISLSFGSSLSNNMPCDRSYGISDFRVYIQ